MYDIYEGTTMNNQTGKTASRMSALILSFALTGGAAIAAEPTSLA